METTERYTVFWRLPSTAWRGACWHDVAADTARVAELLALQALDAGADTVELYQLAPFYRLLQTFTPADVAA